jgi:mxaD protein
MTKHVATFLFAALAFLAAPLALAQAKEQSVLQTIMIDAPPETVWEIAGDFVGLDKWYPLIESSKRILGRNNEIGCIRELTRLNGTKVEEKLIDYNPWDRTLTYTYAGGQPLSSDYFATLTVNDAGGGKSRVEWKARFKRLDYTVDDPAADEKLVKLLTGGYQKGMESLKRLSETRP